MRDLNTPKASARQHNQSTRRDPNPDACPVCPPLPGLYFFPTREARFGPVQFCLSRLFDPAGQRNPPALSPVPAFGVLCSRDGGFFFPLLRFRTVKASPRFGRRGDTGLWGRVEWNGEVYSCRVLSCLCVCTSGLGHRSSVLCAWLTGVAAQQQ